MADDVVATPESSESDKPGYASRDLNAPTETTFNSEVAVPVQPEGEVGLTAPIAPEPISLAADEDSRTRRVWAHRGVWLGLLAVTVGVIGEALLFDESTRGAGATLLAVAAVLAIVAWSGVRDNMLLTAHADTVRQEAAQRKELIRWRRGLALRLAGIAGALGLLFGSYLAYWARPAEIFGLQGVLWVASYGCSFFLASFGTLPVKSRCTWGRAGRAWKWASWRVSLPYPSSHTWHGWERCPGR